MTDHDQRWKTLLREFLPDFFYLYFPAWEKLLDFSQIEWLDKEVFPDPPEGKRRELDLVARLRLTDEGRAAPGLSEELLALIHVEIESRDSATSIDERMPRYYFHLRETHGVPVLPIVLFLQVGFEGIGIRECGDQFGPLQTVIFHYLYVGLPALDGIQYLESGVALGTAMSALMRIPADRRPWFKAEAFQRIAQSPCDKHRRYLLAECVDTYLPLAAEREQEEFQRLLEQGNYEEAKTMTAPTIFQEGLEKGIEKGIEKGMEKGMEKGKREFLLFLIEDQFGPLDEAVRQRIGEMSADRLLDVGRKLRSAKSLTDLELEP